MAYLLDTHTFLWFAAGDKQLPDSVKKQNSRHWRAVFSECCQFMGNHNQATNWKVETRYFVRGII
jgi:hypothetical protein